MTYGPMTELRTLRTDSHQACSAQTVDADTRGSDITGGTMHTAMIVRAAWLLMTQPGVTDITTAALTRAERRRTQREGRETPTVRVVRIRHPENRPGPGDPQGEDAERRYRVRWTVRGHWRRQWYPSRRDHRPVWINPHIKGLDGAPLHHSDTVHLLDAPPPAIGTPVEPEVPPDAGPA